MTNNLLGHAIQPHVHKRKPTQRTSTALVTGLLLGLLGQSAAATDEALLQILLQNKLITQAQYDALRKAVPATPPATVAKQPAPKDSDDLLEILLANGAISKEQYEVLTVKTAQRRAEGKTSREATVSLKDGLKFKSDDGDFSAQIGAYAQLDGAFFGDDHTDLSSGSELRRARLSVAGTVYQDWDYKVEADFAGTTQGGSTNNVTVTDAYLRWTGLKPFSFTAGNFKVPFSLEAVSSAKYTTFMERALPFAFLNLRQLGGMIGANGDNWTGAVGVFGDAVTAQNNDDEGKAVSGRVTWAPLFDSDRVLHLGFAAQWRQPQQNASGSKLETVRFRSKPESNLAGDALFECSTIRASNGTDADSTNDDCVPSRFDGLSGAGRSSGRLVDTGNIGGDVNDVALFGVDLAGVLGPVSLQGEWMQADVYRKTGNDLSFSGYYAQASWFLTGESRAYKADKGIFDLVRPKTNFALGRGWGAWELARVIAVSIYPTRASTVVKCGMSPWA
jgi:phosphate-selective porin OprO/OprP